MVAPDPSNTCGRDHSMPLGGTGQKRPTKGATTTLTIIAAG